MKKLWFFMGAAVLMMWGGAAKATDAFVLEEDVDALFAQAEEVTTVALSSVSAMKDAFAGISASEESLSIMPGGGDKSVVIAFILCWFFGGLGIHRIYLDGPFILVLGYACIPIAGSIAACHDWWALLFKLIGGEGIDHWIGCKRLFVWTCK